MVGTLQMLLADEQGPRLSHCQICVSFAASLSPQTGYGKLFSSAGGNPLLFSISGSSTAESKDLPLARLRSLPQFETTLKHIEIILCNRQGASVGSRSAGLRLQRGGIGAGTSHFLRFL
jgi:hypothetical protein